MKLPITAVAVAIASILLGSGCAAEPDSAVPPEQKPQTQEQRGAAVADQKAEMAKYQRVVIHGDDGAYWFEPTRCSIYEEDGSQLYAIAGAGKAPDGQPVYVTISDEDHDPETGADIRINVGVDAPMKHGDPAWISNDQQAIALDARASKTEVDGKVLTIIDVVFGNDSGGKLEVGRPIRVDCSG